MSMTMALHGKYNRKQKVPGKPIKLLSFLNNLVINTILASPPWEDVLPSQQRKRFKDVLEASLKKCNAGSCELLSHGHFKWRRSFWDGNENLTANIDTEALLSYWRSTLFTSNLPTPPLHLYPAISMEEYAVPSWGSLAISYPTKSERKKDIFDPDLLSKRKRRFSSALLRHCDWHFQHWIIIREWMVKFISYVIF